MSDSDPDRPSDAADEIAELRRRLALAEARAESTDRLLRTVLDNMGNGLVVFDADERLVVANRRFAEMYGFEADDLRTGTPRAEMVRRGTGRTWPGDARDAAEFFAGNTTGEIGLPSGSVYQREIVPTADGGCVITHTDVTERKRTEDELREQQEILQDVFDNVAQGLAAYDENARVITWNRKYQEYLILADDQIYRGCPVWDLVMLHAARGTYGGGSREDLEAQVQMRIDRLMSGGIVRFDYVNARGIEMEAVSAPRPQGGFVVTYADITDRKRAEAEIIRARDEAEAANRAKSSFLAAMSHEIRTPMNGVLGLIEVLQHSELTPDQTVLAETVHESATALLRIIDDILDFSKIEAGRMELEAVPLSLRRTIESALDTVAAVADAKGLDLTLDMPPDLPDSVIGDPVRLRQILLNLLGNGLKFTESGGVSVAVERPAEPEGDGRIPIRISVTDTGIGIPGDVQAILFEPFSQAESTTTRRFGGTGLGLSISRRLVELMDGRIAVDSREGAGSTFHFVLPVAAAPAAETGAQETVDLAGVAAVVVSDRPALVESVRREIRRHGATADAASGGDALARILERMGPAAVFLVDDRLPAENVPGLLTLLEERPAVLLRGTASTTLSAEALGRFRATVNRPIHRGPLLRAIAAALGRTSVGDPADDAKASVQPVEQAAGADGPRILVAEDTPINRFVVERQLAGLGYNADYAMNGREAFDLWRAGRYDLLLADCHMPQVDGFELARMVRDAESRDGAPRMPIIALTANAVAGESEKCLAAGMDDFLAKPVTIRQMGETLARWLKQPTGGTGS